MSQLICRVAVLTQPNQPEAPAMELTVDIELGMTLEEIKDSAMKEVAINTNWNPETCTILLIATISDGELAHLPPRTLELTLVK